MLRTNLIYDSCVFTYTKVVKCVGYLSLCDILYLNSLQVK